MFWSSGEGWDMLGTAGAFLESQTTEVPKDYCCTGVRVVGTLAHRDISPSEPPPVC